MDAIVKVSHLLDVLNTLTERLNEETTLLRAQRVAEIIPLQAEKEQLFTVYESLVVDLQQNPKQLKEVDESTRHSLRQMLKKFHHYAHQNKVAIKAARDARRFVLNAIRDAALDQQKQGTGYTADGYSTPVYKRAHGNTVSVAIDKNL